MTCSASAIVLLPGVALSEALTLPSVQPGIEYAWLARTHPGGQVICWVDLAPDAQRRATLALTAAETAAIAPQITRASVWELVALADGAAVDVLGVGPLSVARRGERVTVDQPLQLPQPPCATAQTITLLPGVALRLAAAVPSGAAGEVLRLAVREHPGGPVLRDVDIQVTDGVARIELPGVETYALAPQITRASVWEVYIVDGQYASAVLGAGPVAVAPRGSATSATAGVELAMPGPRGAPGESWSGYRLTRIDNAASPRYYMHEHTDNARWKIRRFTGRGAAQVSATATSAANPALTAAQAWAARATAGALQWS